MKRKKSIKRLDYCDIESYEKAVVSLARVERALHLASALNDVYVSATSEKNLLEDVCQLYVHKGKYTSVEINFMTGRTPLSLVSVASFGVGAKKNKASLPLAQGFSFSQKKPAVCQDILTNHYGRSLKHHAKKHNYASLITLPLILENEIFGTLTISSANPHAFGKEEVELLFHMGSHLSMAISQVRIHNIESLKNKEILKYLDLTQKYLDLSEASIVELNSKGNVVSLNKKGYDLLEYPVGSLLGKNWFKTVIPECQKQQVLAVFYALMSKKAHIAEHYENKVITKTGKIKDMLWHNVLVRDPEGNLKGVISSGIDITDTKKIQEQMREIKEQFQSLFERSRDAIMTIAPPTWKFTSGNKATLQLFNIKKEEDFLQLGPWQLSPKYQPDGQLSTVKAKKMIDYALKTGSNFFEWTHKEYHGKPFFANVLLSKIEKNGNTYLQATVRDISEQKYIEKALMEREEEYRVLFNSFVDAILIADPKTRRLMYCNDSAEYLLGRSKDEILSMTVDQLHPKDLVDSPMKTFKQQAAGKLKIGFSEVITKNKKRVPVSIYASIIRVRGKTYLQGIFRDITEQKLAEDTLIESYNRLKELDALKTEFLSMTSHELKTPLTPMKAQLQRMLSKDLSREELKQGLNMVLRNETRLERLINEILEISRIESKRLVMSKQLVDIKLIIRETCITMQALATDKHIKLTTHFIDLNFKLVLDAYRIGEVLINLIDNAIKHSNCLEIVVSAYARNKILFIKVHDNGKGISPEDMKHMFEKFYQGKESRGVGVGAGLGLPICKGIIEAHNGTITVQSQLRKGTTFLVKIPIVLKTKPLKTSLSEKEEMEA